MATITGIKRQKRNSERVNLYLDGQFAFGLAAITAVSLKVGQTLTPTDIDQLQAVDAVEQAKQAAIRFIEYRPRSNQEVEKKLQEKGYTPEVIAAAITRLQEVGLLDDLAFARYWVEQREAFRPRSRIALSHELRQKGISRQLIDTSVADIDESAAAKRAVEKKVSRWLQLDEAGFRQKMGGFLQRRGFPYDVIRETTASFWEQVAEEQDEIE